jgi:hypothetical protein
MGRRTSKHFVMQVESILGLNQNEVGAAWM